MAVGCCLLPATHQLPSNVSTEFQQSFGKVSQMVSPACSRSIWNGGGKGGHLEESIAGAVVHVDSSCWVQFKEAKLYSICKRHTTTCKAHMTYL